MNWNRLSQINTSAALTRLLQREFNGSLEEFMAELNRESDRLIRTDLKQALLLTKKTAGLENIIPDQYRAHLYRIWARHSHLSGRYREARKLYGEALELFDQLGDKDGRAQVQKALLDVFMYLREYDEAIAIGKKALNYYRRSGAEVEAAKVMTNLGNLYHRLDENLRALKNYEQAYEIFRRLGNDYAMAVVQFNRGNAYANINDHDRAERLYRQAAGIYRSKGMDLAACQADYSLAYLDFLKGDYSKSMRAFAAAADEFRRLGDERCLALTQLDLAEVNLHLNLFSQVIEDAGPVAESFRELGMSYESAKALYFSAAGYFAFGDFDLAQQLVRKSLALFRKERNQPWQIQCRFLLARIESREQRYPAALGEFRKIAAFYKKQADLRHYYDVRLAWLETLILSDQFGAASRMIREFEKSTGEMAGYQNFVFRMLAGDVNRKRLNIGEAIRYYRRAILQAEKLRAAVFPDEIQRFFWMDKLAAYNRLASLFLEQKKNRQAFEVLERGRTLAAVGPEDRPSGRIRRKIAPQLMEERKRLKAFLRQAVMPVGSADRGLAATSEIRAAEHRLWKIEQELRRQDQNARVVDISDHAGLQAVQKKLKSDDFLLRFVCREDECGVFIVGNSSFEYLPFETSMEELRGLLARFYFMINRLGGEEGDQTVVDNLIDRISDRIWKSTDKKLFGCLRLVVIPDGILSRLPFYILKDLGGQYLFEKYDTYIFSNAADFAQRGIDDAGAKKYDPVSVVAVSEAELPGASLESLSVMRHFPQASVFSGMKGGSESLYDCLKHRGGIVHLIAHASQSYENHLFSRILLSDGPLYPFDLLSHPVRAELVVLSGCQTGDPGLYYYNDSLSLAQVMLAAGAGEVVASYWPVADEVTSRFMDMFYRHLSKKISVYQALKMAMLEMKRQSADIRHWASFYLACR